MKLEQARKYLALGYHIRRKCWKKYWWCERMFEKPETDKPDVEFMVMSLNGKKSYQRMTRVEEQADDWEKVA